MSDEEQFGLEVARVTIVRRMTEGDVIDTVRAEDPDGMQVGLAEALGMMRLAEHTLIEARMADQEDDL